MKSSPPTPRPPAVRGRCRMRAAEARGPPAATRFGAAGRRPKQEAKPGAVRTETIRRFQKVRCPPPFLCPCLPVSLSPCLPVSLSPCLPVSLSPCLLVSLSPCLALPLSLSPCLPGSLSPFLPLPLAPSLCRACLEFQQTLLSLSPVPIVPS